MQSVILTELGIIVFDGNSVTKTFPFKNPATEFVELKKGRVKLDELADYLTDVKTGLKTNDDSLYDILKKKSIDVQKMDLKDQEELQSLKPQFLVKAGFVKNEEEAIQRLRNFAVQLSSAKITEESQSPDLHIIQSINALDEIDKIINGLSSRLREWYGLHFPELDNVIDSINGYAQIVIAGKREDLSEKVFENAGFPLAKVEMLSVITKKSRGGDISNENLSIVQGLARQILNLIDLRKQIEEHIDVQMNEIAPNISRVLGTAVGARILARAGSLKKLAMMPASTIQVLGAEKALFRSLKTGSQPPKHGLLFQHPLVHAAPRWQRGKIARAIASKAAIAARVDIHGGGVNETLLEKLNIRVKEIEEKFKEPVEKKEFKQQKTGKLKTTKKRAYKNKLKKKSKRKQRKKFGRR